MFRRAAGARHKLPAVYWDRRSVTAGGLISYGVDLIDQFRRAAGYVDRILKGERIELLGGAVSWPLVRAAQQSAMHVKRST